MKGSEVTAGSRWGGNPAMEIESAPEATTAAPHDDNRRAALAGSL